MALPLYDPEAVHITFQGRLATVDSPSDPLFSNKYTFNRLALWISQTITSMIGLLLLGAWLVFIGIISSVNVPCLVIAGIVYAYFYFTIYARLALKLFFKFGIVRRISQQELDVAQMATVYDNNTAAQTITDYLQTHGITSLSMQDVLELLNARDRLATGSPGAPAPDEALNTIAQQRGIEEKTLALLSDGELVYLKQIGAVKN